MEYEVSEKARLQTAIQLTLDCVEQLHVQPSAAWLGVVHDLVADLRALRIRDLSILRALLTVVAEHPRIGPYVEAMRERLSGVLGISPAHVSIKGKSNEGMGWIGRREGLAVFAVALIDRMEDQARLFARHGAAGL